MLLYPINHPTIKKMKKIYLGLAIIFSGLLLFPTASNAQWNPNTWVNLLISSLPTADMQQVATSDGKTWIAFYHQNGSNYDMRAQLIDANGYKLLGTDGVLVSNQPSGSATYVFNICLDASNNLVIACQDQRTATMQAVAYKISQTGTHLWSSNGVVLGAGLSPYPGVLSTGETVIAWNDGVSNTISMQKLSTSGTPVWGSTVSVTISGGNTTRAQVVPNLSGKFTLVIQKKGSGISSTLWAIGYSNAGTSTYSPVQLSTLTTSAARYYSVLADGDTTYCGYYASQGMRFNSYLQRVNPDGTIPWGTNGSNFNTATATSDNYQMTTSISKSTTSNYVWSLCTFSDPNQVQYGVYVQKFLKTTGARQLTDLGKAVFPVQANGYQHGGSLALVSDAPMFMYYNNTYQIFATRLDGNGNFAWTSPSVTLSSTSASAGTPKMRYCFTPDGPNRCAGTWTENRGSGYMGYAQGVSIGGLLGIDVLTQNGVPATITTPGGTLQCIDSIWPNTASQAATWSIVIGTGNASISTSGLVTALSNGTVYAKAAAVQDPTMVDSLLITITGQSAQAPLVTTTAATNIGTTTAQINGTINANNYSTAASFEWGLTTAYGNTATATPGTVTGSTTTAVLANLSGLTNMTTYHFRCKGVNSGGTAYGADMTFTAGCNTPVTPGAISGPASVCPNSTGIIYSIAPVTYATSYTWTVPTGATITAGAGTTSITVSFSASASSGNVTVAGTNTCATGPTATLPVTVYPVPVPTISGPNNFCIGTGTATYTTEVGMTNYNWSVTGGTITSGTGTSTIVVQFTTTGSQTVSVNYTNGNGCQATNPTQYSVSVNSLPQQAGAITGDDNLCAGTYGVAYTTTPITGANAYVWAVPAGATIASGQGTMSILVNYSSSAVSGQVTVSGNNLCGNGPASVLDITVNPVPATPVITFDPFTITLSSSAPTGNQWYYNGSALAGETQQILDPVNYGNGYYWTIVTLNGCSSDSSNVLFVIVEGTVENNGLRMSISPVPNDGKFRLSFSGITETVCRLEVLSALGLKVYELDRLSVGNGTVLSVDLGSVSSGVYTLVFSGENLSFKRKFIISK
jgi:hypothetical protein